jgi:hypothetical protein
MYTPYTNSFPQALTIASGCLATMLTAVLWSRPLRTCTATALLGAAIWTAALLPVATELAVALQLETVPEALPVLETSATLASMALILHGPRWFGVLGVLGQLALFFACRYVRDSNYELMGAYLFWYGALIGVHGWQLARISHRSDPVVPMRAFWIQDAAIFLVTAGLASLVSQLVFRRLTFNGDEIANTFQASVYGHLRAYAPLPPCPSMFDNYWVFRHEGRAFSQYTPGWPLFMAPFQRLGVVWLAGPFMAGIMAVGVARLSRRVAAGLGKTPESSGRIVQIAGVIGAISAVFGPSMLLNGASRFSHPMVAACFAWSVESLCVVSNPEASRRRQLGYGLLLGAATALGVATRPADGGTLGVGVFLYFLYALARGRISWRGLLGTALTFVFFAGLTAVILRLQLGAWWQTGYTIAASIHPEAELHLSWPEPQQVKTSLPLATGSYCWWPAAPALGIAGLVQALGGRERRVPFMLSLSALALLGFYFFVEFGRHSDDGLGPRYILPVVVLMATGGAGILAPLVEKLCTTRGLRLPALARSAGPALLATAALVAGVIGVAPLVYPVGAAEYAYMTAPLRGARRLRLKNAIVMIEPGKTLASEWNIAQNDPMDPDPDVLFLIRKSAADEACARQHFPGRTWYRAGMDETLAPY